jgi:hypothetical protein
MPTQPASSTFSLSLPARQVVWRNGWPRFASTGPDDSHRKVVEHWLDVVWQWVALPLLFGLIGATQKRRSRSERCAGSRPFNPAQHFLECRMYSSQPL